MVRDGNRGMVRKEVGEYEEEKGLKGVSEDISLRKEGEISIKNAKEG